MKKYLLLLLFFPFAWAGNLLGAESCSKDIVCIQTEKTKEGIIFYVENKKYYDLTVSLKFTLSNMYVEEIQPLTQVYPGVSKTMAAKLKVKNPKQASRWKYQYFWTRGKSNVKHSERYIYHLPYTLGKSYKLIQGYNGNFSHYGADRYALDFSMPEGTKIHAAREGTVVGVKKDSKIGGPDEKYRGEGNYIAIRHSDGTLGEYSHLRFGGALVKEGAYVQKGQAIGISGNTGFSSTPHLHFSVYSTVNGKKRVSYPLRFLTDKGVLKQLRTGQAYRAIR